MTRPDLSAVLAGVCRGQAQVRPVCCGGTGWVLLAAGAVRCEECAPGVEARLERYGVPEALRSARLDRVEPELAEHASALSALVAAGLERYRATGAWSERILFVGKCGVGKTYLAAGIVRALAEAGHRAVWRKAAHLLDDIARAARAEDADTEAVLRPLRSAPVLVLEDLGAHRTSEAAIHRLEDLVDDLVAGYRPPEEHRRFRGGAPVAERRLRVAIVTSNLDPEEEGDRGKLGERLASRLGAREWRLVRVEGQDLRERAR